MYSMEGTRPADHLLKFYYYFLIIILLWTGRIESKVYIVGDEEGWSTGTNYLAWSQKYNFSNGDVLVFDYVKGQHNAIEVTEDTYRSCDTGTSGAVLERYESGHDRVTLAQAKKYWFVCDVSGHCLGGMKFRIDVMMNTNTTDGNDIAAPNPAQSTSPTQTLQNLAGGGGGKALTNYVLVAFGISVIIPNNWF